jgi:hypothetical protein
LAEQVGRVGQVLDGTRSWSLANTWWLSDTTASCASTTSTLKSDIIEAWKRRKKNHWKEA